METHLAQLLNYLDLLKQRPFFEGEKDKVIGCALAQTFPRSTLHLLASIQYLNLCDGIDFVRYVPSRDGKTARFEKVDIEDLIIERRRTLKSALSTQCYLSFYNGGNFEKRFWTFDQLRVITVLVKDSTGRLVPLRDFLHVKESYLTPEALRHAIQDLRLYVEREKNNDYSEASLLLEIQEIETSALEMIQVYNCLLRRPPIVLC